MLKGWGIVVWILANWRKILEWKKDAGIEKSTQDWLQSTGRIKEEKKKKGQLWQLIMLHAL